MLIQIHYDSHNRDLEKGLKFDALTNHGQCCLYALGQSIPKLVRKFPAFNKTAFLTLQVSKTQLNENSPNFKNSAIFFVISHKFSKRRFSADTCGSFLKSTFITEPK